MPELYYTSSDFLAGRARTGTFAILRRLMEGTQIPEAKEPVGLLLYEGLRPDDVTLLPWSRGKSMAWDDTVPDTFSAS